ncbi:MAG: hypothetical protein KJZ84_15570 [Bryobacteraceae bacterium]|nr:hypothetical protein [Bryobacteraceae bacterium]
MRLRTELLFYTLLLASLNLLLAFGAIGLFARMGPAIERILEENVLSIDAAEEILAEFAAAPAELPPEAQKRVSEALERARANITEAEEIPLLNQIQTHLPAAGAGDSAARAAVLDGLRRLIAANRQAMTKVDFEARRLGTAGAWAAVFIGGSTFGLSLVVIVLLRRRILEPVLEIHSVLNAARRGDRFRRCRSVAAAVEVRQATEALNALLDERYKPQPPLSGP